MHGSQSVNLGAGHGGYRPVVLVELGFHIFAMNYFDPRVTPEDPLESHLVLHLNIPSKTPRSLYKLSLGQPLGYPTG